MRILSILSFIFLLSCTTPAPYVDSGVKKATFNPNLDSSCIMDKSISRGLFSAPGKVCAHENGIIFIKHNFSKFDVSQGVLDKMANDHCSFDGRRAKFLGKAKIAFVASLDFGGIEYTCI